MLQLSKIKGCTLERIAQLPHDFELGACGTFLFPEPRVMFCFAESDRKKCFRWDAFRCCNQELALQCLTDSSVTMDKVMTIIQAQFTIIIGLHWEILTIWLSRLVLGVHRTFKWNHSISRGIYGQLRSHIHFVQKRNRKCKILKNGMHFDNFFGNIWIRYYRNSFMLLQPSCVWSRQFNWFNLDYWWKMW